MTTYTPEQLWAAYRASAGAVLRVSLKPVRLHHSPKAGLHVSWNFHETGQEFRVGFPVERGERVEGALDVTLHGANVNNPRLLHKVQIRFIRAATPEELGL